MFSPFKYLIMKKLTFCFLASSFVFLVSPTQIKASTENSVAPANATATIKSAETNTNDNSLNEIKAIEFSSLSTPGNKETLKESGAVNNSRYEALNSGKNSEVAPAKQLQDGVYVDGRNNHRGTYIGIGSVLIIVLILILIL